MAVLLAAAMPVTQVLAAAPQKDQTVYVNADENGNVEKIIVSNRLKNTKKDMTLKDRSELKGIYNVKGEETFTQKKDGTLTWNADGSDIYYQGESERELPVSVKLKYFLDGKEMKASEIAGKSGKVKICIDYKNLSEEKNKEYTQFLMVTGMILPAETFSNIEVKNGRVISDGKNEIVVGIGFPGLGDALKISELKEMKGKEIPSSVEISADVREFELGMTVTAATTGTLSELGLDENFADTGKLEEKLDLLTDSSKALKDGSQKLRDGAQKLNSSVDTLTDGLNSADDGAGKLKEGIDAMNAKKGELTDGIGSLVNGAADLKNGAAALEQGSGEFKTQLSTYTEQVSKISEGLAQLDAAVQSYSPMIGLLPEDIRAQVQILMGSLAQLDAGAQALGAYNEPLNGAAAQLNGGAVQLNAGIGDLQEGASALAAGAGALSDGIGQLSAGAAELKNGTGQLSDGGRELKNGTSQLEAGAASLADGLQKFDEEGVQKLTDVVENELKGFLDRIKETADADKNYKAFDGADETMDGKVKFIIRTDAVKAEK